MQNIQSTKGFSIIEMMVALALSIVATGAVIGVYVASAKNYEQDERYSRVQEIGRYALKQVADDLLMADFWGHVLAPDTITTGLTLVANDCADSAGIFDGDPGMLYNNGHVGSTTFTPCTEITTDQQANTDILVIKRVEGMFTAIKDVTDFTDLDGDNDRTETISDYGFSDLQLGTVYLRSTNTTGSFIDNADSGNTPASGESDWRYMPRIYFIRDHFQTAGDGIPSLCRMELVTGNEMGNPETDTANEPQCIAEGVQDLHIEFGVDTDTDLIANVYLSDPTVAELEQVVSAKIHLLARSEQPAAGYTNSKTYQLGSVSLGPFNDNFYRQVFTTTVSTRNTAALNILNN